MRKAILMVLLAVVSSSATGEWVKIGSSSDENVTTTYFDPITIRKVGNKVKMWHMFDLKLAKTVESITLRSVKKHSEFDCKKEEARMLASVMYSGNMGGGNPVFSVAELGKWAAIPPDTIEKSLWKIACGKQ